MNLIYHYHNQKVLSKYISLAFLLIFLSLMGCTAKDASNFKPGNKEVYSGHFKTGSAYTIKNKTYAPMQQVRSFSQTGMASWYGKNDHGKRTANGDYFDIKLLTAAHKSLPLPSIVEVENLENSKKLIVMINDRGPFIQDRIIDVSEKAAELLGFKKDGVAKVKITYLEKETNELLDKLNLKPKHGYATKTVMKDRKCPINCHLKLVNLKYGLITKDAAIN